MKYKVGDLVKLRDDLEVGKSYSDIIFFSGMRKLKNTPLTIIEKDETENVCRVNYSYNVGYHISEEMIEGLWEECQNRKHALAETLKQYKPKYKLIDILNKIANGELKEGTKVIYDEETYTLNDENELERDLGFTLLDDIYMNNLSDEAELIEPECISNEGKTSEVTDNAKIEELDKEEMMFLTQQCAIAVLTDKLNEVIRYINKGVEK